MPTVYARRFDLKASLTDSEVAAFWKYAVEQFLPACLKANGVRTAKFYSGAGALRADLRVVIEMDHAGFMRTFSMIPRYTSMSGNYTRPSTLRHRPNCSPGK